jgi:hypothetical protein
VEFVRNSLFVPPVVLLDYWAILGLNKYQSSTHTNPRSIISMKILLSLIVLLVVNVQAEILIYKRTVKSTTMGHGFTSKTTVRGSLIIDPSTGAAAEFDVDETAKEFLSRSKTFTVSTVDAGRDKNYVVFAEVLSGTENGGPYKLSFTAKGMSVSLDVGLTGNRSVARRMQSIGRDVYSFGVVPFIGESVGTFVIDLPTTQSANAAGRTVDELVALIRSDLIDKGFRDARPPGLQGN